MIVVSSIRFCMIRWLPRSRIATNPFCSSTRQTSSPDRTRSLPNGNLDLGDEHLAAETPDNFGPVGGFEEKSEGLNQIRFGFIDRSALARDVEFRAKRHKSRVFSFDDRR